MHNEFHKKYNEWYKQSNPRWFSKYDDFSLYEVERSGKKPSKVDKSWFILHFPYTPEVDSYKRWMKSLKKKVMAKRIKFYHLQAMKKSNKANFWVPHKFT